MNRQNNGSHVFTPIKAAIPAALCLLGLLRLAGGAHAVSPMPAAAPPDPPYIEAPRGTLTYSKDIHPIIEKHCATCHRPGQVAPFALLTATDCIKRATQIADITGAKLMPPWKADSHGEFLDENRLTLQERGLIKQWAQEGAKPGASIGAIQVKADPEGWSLGKPDMVLSPSKTYTLAAEGRDEFHTFVLPTNLKEDAYLEAVEVRPGNTRVVHHTILYVDTDGQARKRAAAVGADNYGAENGAGVPSGVVDIWTPGKQTRRLPAGIGMIVPRGSDLVLEIHYHRTGKAEPDLTKAALYFSKKTIVKRMRMFALPVRQLWIPAGEANYKTGAKFRVPDKVTLYSIFPHMHLLGKSMTVTMKNEDGRTASLLNVPDWDFNWQNTYVYKDPIPMAPGQTLEMNAIYDNSVNNPRNPTSPPRTVTWGEQTTDEMGLVFFGYTVDRENIPAGVVVPDTGAVIRRGSR
jgi:Copper type II ascorbate-dependent monooxygenase, C-terminal domain